MARYDYDRRYGRGRPDPYMGWYPGAFWAGVPMYGWGAWTWPPYPGPMAYPVPGPEYFDRRPPRESPTYGRGGDRAVRRWAERHGYDAGYAIPPRREATRPTRPYDRGW